MPLADLVLLPASATPADLQRAVSEHGYSRYVLADDDGEPVGYLHMKDVMEIGPDAFTEPVPAKRVRRLIAVPATPSSRTPSPGCASTAPTWPCRSTADGVTRGVLFVEDAIEVLVGEINDATAA